MDPVEAQPRQVFFFDTPDLALNRAGVVVRARRIQGGRGDTVIKLRPVEPAQLPADLRRQADFNVEVDALPGGFVCSASFKGRATGAEVRDAVARQVPAPAPVLQDAARVLPASTRPRGSTSTRWSRSGPRSCSRRRFGIPTGFDGKGPERLLVAEMWLYPDGSRILELSTKCAPSEAFTVAAETRAYLISQGVSLARRAADQDQDGPGVLRRRAGRGRGGRLERPDHVNPGRSSAPTLSREGPVAALHRRDRRRRGHPPRDRPVPWPVPRSRSRSRSGPTRRPILAVQGRRGRSPSLVAAAILVLAQRFVRPVIVAFTGRLLLSTMGLFLIIVNALVLWVATLVAPDLATVAQPAIAVAPGVRRAVHAARRGGRTPCSA